LSADGQGFRNAVPASLVQCDGRFLLSSVVVQDAHEFNILSVFIIQVMGFICFFHVCCMVGCLSDVDDWRIDDDDVALRRSEEVKST
jgi:hypothetical protein